MGNDYQISASRVPGCCDTGGGRTDVVHYLGKEKLSKTTLRG